MSGLVRRRNTCRLCNSPRLELVLRLVPTPPVDAYVTEQARGKPQEHFPLDAYLCLDCGHNQLLDVVDPRLLFGTYLYETTSSPGLVEHFRLYAADVLARAKPAAGALAVDVGSNDGTLLRFFKKSGLRVLGVDPAEEIARRATESGIETRAAFFTAAVGRDLRRERGAAALVTANNVFAHADDLGGMVDGVRELLVDDGMFVFEVSYLVDLVDGMVFDFIYHEHLSNHSIKPLRRFLRAHGLELVDVSRNASKGGTIRCFAQKRGGPRQVAEEVERLERLEIERGFDKPALFKEFAARIDAAKVETLRLLGGFRGRAVAGYGASATSTVLIHHFGLEKHLAFLVDDNPRRQGLFSPGHHIPVLAPSAIADRKAACVVILAWRFADAILQRNQAFAAAGGRFLIPLPKPRLL